MTNDVKWINQAGTWETVFFSQRYHLHQPDRDEECNIPRPDTVGVRDTIELFETGPGDGAGWIEVTVIGMFEKDGVPHAWVEYMGSSRTAWDIWREEQDKMEAWRSGEDRKDTNPKDGIGLTKAALSAVPLPGLLEGALAMMEGALKYGRHNYREAGIRYSVYFDAMVRHLFAWFEGEDRAPDSGVHHLGHVLAGCAILLDDILSAEPKGNDDRPPVTHDAAWLPEFNRRVKELLEKHPNPVPPYTEK